MAPGTLWRRALRRVNRRAATYLARKGSLPPEWAMASHEAELLAQAVRLANDLSRGAR